MTPKQFTEMSIGDLLVKVNSKSATNDNYPVGIILTSNQTTLELYWFKEMRLAGFNKDRLIKLQSKSLIDYDWLINYESIV